MGDCTYKETNSDGYYTTYKTTCGKSVSYEVPEEVGMCFAPLPTDNGNKYCSYCGGVLKVE